MSEQDSVATSSPSVAAEAAMPLVDCQSPPPAAQPPRDELPDPRMRLLQLAAELARSRNRRMLAEFLRLRRAV